MVRGTVSEARTHCYWVRRCPDGRRDGIRCHFGRLGLASFVQGFGVGQQLQL